ncbi:MAG: response regulator [Chloroflexi bacterium]|nr:response regulator [Chloroflexota bacterium]
MPAGTGNDADHSTPLVLVVEDDRPTRALLEAVFEQEGLACRLCSNGHEAMEQARNARPQLVILDAHLPSVQGEAVATALRIELGAHLPILLTSAASEADLARRVGAYAYLQKPFDIDELMRNVRQGLNLSPEHRGASAA